MKSKFDSIKAASKARRDKEIKQYGKLVSRRASIVHKSKKDYNRQRNKKIKIDD